MMVIHTMMVMVCNSTPSNKCGNEKKMIWELYGYDIVNSKNTFVKKAYKFCTQEKYKIRIYGFNMTYHQ